MRTLDRGIPAGYVNALEKRLAETERALFFALAEARSSTRSDATAVPAMRPSVLFRSTPTTQQEKAGLMAVWGNTPLKERAQVEAWFEENAAGGGLRTRVDFSQAHATGGVDAVPEATPSVVGPANIGSLAAQTHHDSQLGIPSLTAEDDGQGRHSGSPRLRMRAQRTPRRVPGQPRISRGSATARPTLAQMSRASKLANDNKNLYF